MTLSMNFEKFFTGGRIFGFDVWQSNGGSDTVSIPSFQTNEA
jgi:hypothetical protein